MKKLMRIFLCLVLVLSITACGSEENEKNNVDDGSSSEDVVDNSNGDLSDEKEQTVTMWTFLDPDSTANGRNIALAEMIKTFEAEHQGVTINVESQDYNTMTAKFLAATTTGDAPDIIWCGRDEIPGVLDANALEPLENLFLDEWSDEEVEDINDGFFSYGTRDDNHYVLCLSKNAPVLYYRADLFEENNLEVPKTWEGLVEVAKALTGNDVETGMYRYGLGQSFSTESTDAQLMANMILDSQGTMFNEDGTANWATKEGEEALDWTLKCINEWEITPQEAVNTTNEDLFLQFKAGKYAMIIGGGVRAAAIKEEATFDADYVQLSVVPGSSEGSPSPAILDGWFVGVWSESEQKEMAGKFLEHMYTPEADELWVKTGGQAPVRKSTLENLSDHINTEENKFLAVLSEGFATGWLPEDDLALTGWMYDINQTVINVLIEDMSMQDALKSSESDFNTRNSR